MRLEAQRELLHGPYAAPEVRVGQEIECQVRGNLTVRRFSKGPLIWPMGHPGGQDGGRHSYIICGDLLRAVQSESNRAVQYWWGVSEAVVTRWREALGVEINTEGTRHLRMLQASGTHSSERLEQRRRHILSQDGKRKQHEQPVWPSVDEALLGTIPDKQAAAKLGRTVFAVQIHRKTKGIPAYCRGRSPVRRLSPDRVVLSSEKVKARRLALGLLQVQVAQNAGLSQERYRNYEKCVYRQVDQEVVSRLAEVFSCLPGDLIASTVCI